MNGSIGMSCTSSVVRNTLLSRMTRSLSLYRPRIRCAESAQMVRANAYPAALPMRDAIQT